MSGTPETPGIDSPLTTTDPMSLEVLLDRNPEDLTPADMKAHLKKLVPELRAKRKRHEQWDNETHKGGRYGAGPNRSLPKNCETLDDLFGGD